MIRSFVRQLTRRAIDNAEPKPRRQQLPPGECAYCDRERAQPGQSPMPPHDASRFCESGKHNHCTCDTCF